MSTLCCNCRGASNAATVQELRDFAKKFAPTLLCIVETQLEGSRVEALAGTLGYDNSYAVSSRGRNGGICMFWNNEINIELLGYSDYHLDCSVLEQGEDPWRLTVVYGEAQTHMRYQTWDTLKNISTLSSLPWLCVGDFNEVLRPEEHVGVGQRSNAQIQAFRDAVDVCMLLDIGYTGIPWTFEKKVTGGTFTRVRLDRALASVEWQARFPLADLTHLVAATSDHSPILANLNKEQRHNQRHSTFKYEVMWEGHESWSSKIAETWANTGAATRLEELRAKLSAVSQDGAME